jgi:hypothetical protein
MRLAKVKQYYLCPLLGDGTDGNEYRPAVADINVDHVAWVPTDAVTGRPTKPWALILASAVDHTAITALAGVEPLPNAGLDQSWGSLSSGAKLRAITAMQARGIDTSVIQAGTPLREVLRLIARACGDGFSENRFDVN